jgi:hypothetical protein
MPWILSPHTDQADDHTHRSHALRGNAALGRSRVPVRDAERLWMRYHAERGNDGVVG